MTKYNIFGLLLKKRNMKSKTQTAMELGAMQIKRRQKKDKVFNRRVDAIWFTVVFVASFTILYTVIKAFCS